MASELEKSKEIESPEEKASEELLNLGLQSIPENIRAVLDLQKARQHPEGFEDIVEADSLEKIGKAMKDKNVKQFIHAEGPNVWSHVKFAVKLVDFMNAPEEKKDDLKLILLYHDLGKTTPGIENRPLNKDILKKGLEKGKLYQPVSGHASERLNNAEAGFRANGVTGRKLEIFMTVVKNHMETSLAEMSGTKLVKLFEKFGKNDEERKEVAELLATVVQIDSNAGSRIDLDENGEPAVLFKDNRTGLDFDKIWERYLEAKK